MKLTAIIMASGFSTRMKENKLKLKIDQKKMYEYSIDLVSQYDFAEKILVSNDDEILSYASSKGIKTFENPQAEIGKSSSIKIGVRHSAQDTKGYMFFVADQPFLSLETVDKIVQKFIGNPKNITVPYYDGKRGAPMIFPRFLKDDLLQLKEDEGGVLLIPENEMNPVSIQDGREHFDIDTPTDYETI
ncbi:MAG: NTP transferase domain-containing protein [Tissierellia bacterium]|nr:NTP transferase domain-containing protein [Tissierellia bacterium]